MKDKELLKSLLKNGWKIDRINGSRHILKKGDQIISIPIHGRDIPAGLLNKLLKQAGLK